MFFRREANLHILLIAYFYVCIQTYNNLALVCSTAEKIEVLNFFCLQSVPQMSQVVTAFTDSLSKSLTRCHLNQPINEQVASLLLSVVSNNAQAFVGHFAQVVFRGFCRGFVVFFSFCGTLHLHTNEHYWFKHAKHYKSCIHACFMLCTDAPLGAQALLI